MRIRHVACIAPPRLGGIGMAAVRQVEGLRARGHEVELVVPAHPQAEPREGFCLWPTRYAWGNAALFQDVDRLWQDIDVLHLHYPFYGVAEQLLLGKKPPVPVVVSVHMDAEAEDWREAIFRAHRFLIQPTLLRRADHIIVASRDYAQTSSLQEFLQHHPDKVSELPFFVDDTLFTPQPPLHQNSLVDVNNPLDSNELLGSDENFLKNTPSHFQEILHQNNLVDSNKSSQSLHQNNLYSNESLGSERIFLKKTPPHSKESIDSNKNFFKKISPRSSLEILFVGALDHAHGFKGLPVLLSALARMPWARLTIVGDGNRRAAIEAEVVARGLSERITFLGRVSQERLVQAYQTADVLAFPSTSKAEAFGLVALEAQACGTPVVASRLPGVREVVLHEVTGLTVTPGSVDELCRAFERLYRDEAFRIRLGTAARARVETSYAREPLLTQLENLYKDVCASRL